MGVGKGGARGAEAPQICLPEVNYYCYYYYYRDRVVIGGAVVVCSSSAFSQRIIDWDEMMGQGVD